MSEEIKTSKLKGTKRASSPSKVENSAAKKAAVSDSRINDTDKDIHVSAKDDATVLEQTSSSSSSSSSSSVDSSLSTSVPTDSSSSSSSSSSTGNGNHQDLLQGLSVDADGELCIAPQVLAGMKPYDAANSTLHEWCRKTETREKIYYFEDYKYTEWLTLNISTAKRPGEAETGVVNLCYKKPEMKYSLIQSPIGVLTFSNMTFEGSRHDTGQFAPKTPTDIKQGVSWSPRAYCDEGRDEHEPGSDHTGLKFAKFLLDFGTTWFTEQLVACGAQTGLAKHINKVVQQLKTEKKPEWDAKVMEMRALGKSAGQQPAPTADEIKKRFPSACVLDMIRLDKYQSLNARFSTRLLRKVFKNESFTPADPYRAPTPFLQDLYHATNGNFIFNDIPIYTLRSQEELKANWGKISLYKKIPRDQIVITNGMLGSIIFDPSPTLESGAFCQMMGYLKGVILYNPGTELSKEIPVLPGVEGEFPLLDAPPAFVGSHCFYDEKAPKLALSSSSMLTIENGNGIVHEPDDHHHHA